MARVTNTVSRTVTNEDGQITHQEEEKTINWGSEPNYIKIYLDTILYLKDLPKGLNGILYAFLKRMSYGNQLVVNAALKRQIAKELDLSLSSINNGLSKFVKGEILFREDTGLYKVNPHLFGKGEWKDIAKIRLEITFDKNGKTVMSEIERKEEIERKRREEQSENQERKLHWKEASGQ
ncbi:replication/maintenance protein RepL [Aquibacillus koreensis]|uniref:Replication/maintenance protein RepL n=1 Tax=Aquibacillus koreensis TaxID=279446 RepID=A0A9X3WSY8_9BACI|nr:replication/maintenance protein RepL [Aquibacillus koreensis]MDC3422864.1 replication/maintenance protein RepL [Aquibacillus koreensis]